VSVGCPTVISITPAPPYKVGDVLTCSSDGFLLSYKWFDNDDMYTTDAFSTSTTVNLDDEGDIDYTCTATATLQDGTQCALSEDADDTVYGKYPKPCL